MNPTYLFYFTIFYSSLALALLPFVGCQHAFQCPASPPGTVSVSHLVHRGALAASYAYMGGLFLLCIFFFQMHHSSSILSTACSFVGVKLLAIPLMVPLGSLPSDSLHDVCGVVGGFLLFLVSLFHLFDKYSQYSYAAHTKAARNLLGLTTLLMFATIMSITIVAYTQENSAYSILALEFVYGFSLATNAVVSHMIESEEENYHAQ